MTILRRFHVQYPSTTAWVDITGRVIGNVRWTEGRNLTLLGGPLPPAVPASMQCTFDNNDGYFTTGVAGAFGPGARFRMQWRATTGDAWTTRFVGRLSEYRLRTGFNARLTLRFYGALLYLTAGELPERNYGSREPELTMGLMCDTVGVPAADRNFDTSTDMFAITAAQGYAGVIQFADLVSGFIYDTPDGKVRLELPATRTAKAISQRYTDATPGANELGIPPPEVQTNPFGIINHVTGELRVFSPLTGDEGVTVDLGRQLNLTVGWPDWTTYTASATLSFQPSDGVVIDDYQFNIQVKRRLPPSISVVADFLIDENRVSPIVSHIIRTPNDVYHTEIRDWAFTVIGNVLQLHWEMRLWKRNGDIEPASYSDDNTTFGASRAVVDDLYAVLQHEDTYTVSVEDVGSQSLHGIRRRTAPLVVSQFVADLTNFTPDLSDLETRVDEELARYSSPHEVYIIETTAATVAERTALLARRLSDKVHLRLTDISQLSVDADFFVEAMETTLTPEGNATQRLHVVEGPPPEAPDDAPTGFTVTRNSASQATLAWDSGTVAAARFNIYRGDAANNLTLLRGDFGDGATVEYIDNTLSSPNEYWYAVAAENNGGEGPQTAAMRAGWPQQPTGFQVFRLDNMSLLLFWDNPNDSGITGYRIWRGTSSGNINTQIESSEGSASTTQYTDDGLADGQEYWYQIQALYGVIASVRSDSASGIP